LGPERARDRRHLVFVWIIVLLAVLMGLSVVPTAYYLIAPGSAVELSTRIAVAGRPPPRRRFYLTDVTVTRASALLLGAGLWPGCRLVPRSELVPPGESARVYDRILVDAMQDSQRVAAFVAERAAGLRVPLPPERVFVADVIAGTRAVGILEPGDRLMDVNGTRVQALQDVANAADSRPPGLARVEVERAGRTLHLAVPTTRTAHGVRIGILARERGAPPDLPIPVHFAVGDISGSSAGLMFALEIYAALHPALPAGSPVAGTGTIAPDGRVGPVEGALQKLIAARRAGAATFLVPRQNYPEIAHEPNIRIVPVTTFQEALTALTTPTT
jgi:PDZ domain-containing protein